MPLAFGLVAIMAIVIAIRGNYATAGALFNSTFFGGTNGSGFLKWFGSILGIAIIFRIIGAPKAGQLFIGLLILVYFMENNGIVSNIEQAIAAGASQNQATTSPGTTAGTSAGQSAAPALNAVTPLSGSAS